MESSRYGCGRRSTFAPLVCTYVLIVISFCLARVEAASICLEQQSDCIVEGSVVDVAVMLRPDGVLISGAQMEFSYDSSALTFVGAVPGSVCDASSPFAQEVFVSVNESAGTVTYAVGPLLGENGSDTDTTLACLSFVAGAGASEACLSGLNAMTFLAGAQGTPVPIDNSAVCPGTGDEVGTCLSIAPGDSCTCGAESADCSPASSSCAVGTCVEDGGGARCIGQPMPDGTPCDDGSSCSSDDQCVSGFCAGSGCDNPSLCLVADSGCEVEGGVQVRVELGAGGTPILGAQVLLSFNPDEVELLGVLPGSACDPASPFAVEIEKIIDVDDGNLFYAVGVDFTGGVAGTSGPATLACLHVAPVGNILREICIEEGSNPQRTILTSSTGQQVDVFEGLICPTNEPGSLTCADVKLNELCECEADTEDCSIYDTDCREGYCGFGGVCLTQAINNGGSCDDGSACSINDTCSQKTCRGFGCEDPSLCIDGPGCVGPGLNRRVIVRMGETNREIVGSQFLLSYDPSVLQFVSMSPGGTCDDTSPYVNEVYASVDETLGEIFYAVGIDLDGSGSTGPAAMACIDFIALKPEAGDVCLLQGFNPLRSLFSDASGGKIQVYNNLDCPFVNGEEGVLACEEVCTVPTMSAWGLGVLGMMLLVLAKVVRIRRVPVS